MSMITNLEHKNFTAFIDLAIDFSHCINIVISENDASTIQLLKAFLGQGRPKDTREVD
ncbi:hypothetical protein K3Z95_14325 [Pseudomonas aeruginosa]|uniref:hypothetical protein n=2 Tax=Pseudomonas aeruginosa TaxID=287 RepID=UPI000AB9AF36|nr:hypothetical protein [Pseudomonas aeruginosa]MBG6976173.1 hypothetical protein [Pseudomonas aeruginosa]MCR3809342.1 hypothetical protein [Pseudomonas aeruginosa]MDT8224959.1 hypothetical protein [Pseudomonas aeruginosa]MDW8832381.1 hypothetical protein [Pseudomonas aeruginosa]MDX1897751.1 hypothetical protein [Pseudomonas aeruginosa]